MGSSSLNSVIFDEVRKSFVKATPEEKVRQRWLQGMIHQLKYPKELLVVEKELKELPHLFAQEVPERRIDVLCYAKGIHPSFPLYPLLLIECKERLTQDAIDQVIGYNHHVNACFVAVVDENEVRLGAFNREQNNYQFCSHLPPFKELLQWVKP